MDTACLRLKFTPFINKELNNSNCCLEIIPQISCIENLDKIHWKADKDCLEYNIPMLYKIVIKKNEVSKQHPVQLINKTDKVYYSCIDLTTDCTKNVIPSYDLTRYVSENEIFEKLDELNKTLQNASNSEDECKNESLCNDSDNLIRDVYSTSLKNTLADESFDVYKNKKVYDTVVEKYHQQLTNKGDGSYNLCKAITRSQHQLEKSTEILAINLSSDPTRLSVTPICSKDTTDTAPDFNRNSSINSSVFCIYGYPKANAVSHLNYLFSNTFFDLANNALRRAKVNHVSITTPTARKPYDSGSAVKEAKRRNKELINIRVAQMMYVIEKEMSPLKIKLNNLLKKCAHLGLGNKNVALNNKLLLYKSVNDRKVKQPSRKVPAKRSSSNRMVYSFVFNG